MSKNNHHEKILSEENLKSFEKKKLDQIYGTGNKFTPANFEKKTEDIWIKETGIPKN